MLIKQAILKKQILNIGDLSTLSRFLDNSTHTKKFFVVIYVAVVVYVVLVVVVVISIILIINKPEVSDSHPLEARGLHIVSE